MSDKSGIDPKDLAALTEILKKLESAAAGEKLEKAMLTGGFVLERGIKLSFHGTKSGRTYARGKKSHQASAPGETPAIDYGNLLNSIMTETSVKTETRVEVNVGTNVSYAEALEFGTSKMAARPFMKPTAARYYPAIIRAVRVALVKEIEGAAK